MRLLLIGILSVLPACASTSQTDEAAPDASVAEAAGEPAAPATTVDPAPELNDCELLPCDGACSLACDPEAMAEQYLPVGVCALFACPLRDGRTMHVDVCHYQ